METSLLGEKKHHCDLSCLPRREVSIELEVFQHVYKGLVGSSEAWPKQK